MEYHETRFLRIKCYVIKNFKSVHSNEFLGGNGHNKIAELEKKCLLLQQQVHEMEVS